MEDRKNYLRQIQKWKEQQGIHILTGIRRCGKTTLLSQYEHFLLQEGISPSQILRLDFETLEDESLLEKDHLLAWIQARLQPEREGYAFLEEVQWVRGFEKVAAYLYTLPDLHLYMSSSSALLLSSLQTLLPQDSLLETRVFPFFFQDFYQHCGNGRRAQEVLEDYLYVGGMPAAWMSDSVETGLFQLQMGIANTVLAMALEEWQANTYRDGKRNIWDISLLKMVIACLCDSMGSPVSLRQVRDFINARGRKVSLHTIEACIQLLCDAFLFYKVPRYDTSQKAVLSASPKYYIADPGLYHVFLPKNRWNFQALRESMVCMELLRQGHTVTAGKDESLDPDFIACKGTQMHIYKVTEHQGPKGDQRKILESLKRVDASWKKTVLTLDPAGFHEEDGIEIVHLTDWLAGTCEK